MQTLVVGNTYDFSVYANSVLGSTYKNQRLTSILDYQSALRFDNIVLLHRQIYPFLPQGTVSDATKYIYYCFVDQTGKRTVLADVWIDDSTIVQSSGTDVTFVLRNVTTGQAAIVRDQLRLLGIAFDVL